MVNAYHLEPSGRISIVQQQFQVWRLCPILRMTVACPRLNHQGHNQRPAVDPRQFQRRVIVKAEHTALGSNPRFVVTNLPGTDQCPTGTVGLLSASIDRVYCAHGDMENRLKDQQLDLSTDRTSCHRSGPTNFGCCCRRWRIP